MRLYVRPNNVFLETYFRECLRLSRSDIEETVESIDPDTYMFLREGDYRRRIINEVSRSLSRCRDLMPGRSEPGCCIFVGFFSAPSFLIYPGGSPVIAVSLERRPDPDEAHLLAVHEYGHYIVGEALGGKDSYVPVRAVEWMASEGLAVHFSRMVYPDRPAHQHFFISRRRLAMCRKMIGGAAGAELIKKAASFFTGEPLFPGGCRAYFSWRAIRPFCSGTGPGDFEETAREVFGRLQLN